MTAPIKETYHYIHNVFSHFYKDTLDYFSEGVYPRFEYSVIGTYDKAVEYIRKQCKFGREIDKPMLPALVLNPNGDFGPADGNAGGRQFWRYPNLSPGLSKRLYDPIYQDQNIIIYASFLRIKGEIELIMLLNSFYEYCDVRLLFFNIFGGLDRIIYPQFFSSFIILPDTLINYNYDNEYTNQNYNIDWNTADAYDHLVRSTARNELVVPLNIKPQYSLTNLSDASNRYGGTDNIADWKLTASINYEIEIPNYLVLQSDYLAENVNLEIRYDSVFSMNNDYQPPVNRILNNFSWSWGLNPDTNSDILDINDVTAVITYVGDFIFKTRYFHKVEESEINDSTNYLIITLPEQIIDPKILIVNSSFNQLDYGAHYLIGDNGWSLMINLENVPLKPNTFLELYVYEKMGE